jgi:hypothetical protein
MENIHKKMAWKELSECVMLTAEGKPSRKKKINLKGNETEPTWLI